MTKFSVGLWDRLFGKKVELEVPSPDGTIRRHVTERWLQKMEAAGKISQVQPQDRARRLVGDIQLAISASAIDFADSDSTLHWALNRLDVWQLCLTAASIGLATAQERDRAGLVNAVDQSLAAENPLLREAVQDFASYMWERKERIPRDLIPAHIGLWVLWNVKGASEPPDDNDTLAVPKVGHFCLRMAAIWDTAPI